MSQLFIQNIKSTVFRLFLCLSSVQISEYQVLYRGRSRVRISVEKNRTPEPDPGHAGQVTGRKLPRAVF